MFLEAAAPRNGQGTLLSELRVRELGVIEDLSMVFGAGMTALTGETGAGKTLVVEAVELLLGARADPVLVRPGAVEAVVEGRFVVPDEAGEEQEVVLTRVVPRDGRSRAYVDGRMAAAGALAEMGARLVDLHGQHAHQSLLSAASQRDALDLYTGVDRSPRDAARERVRQLGAALAGAGGSTETRQREIELLEYQLAELEAAKLTTASEDDDLAAEEEALARASEHRAAAVAVHEVLAGEDQVVDRLGEVLARLSGRGPLAGLYERLRGLAAELSDAAGEARALAESLEDDPERLAEVTSRRALLHELRRKYGSKPLSGDGPGPSASRLGGDGDVATSREPGRHGLAGTLDGVFEWQTAARERLQELEDLAGEAGRLAGEHADALAKLRRASEELGAARRAAATNLGAAVEAEMRRLAMPKARFEVRVGVGSGDAGEMWGEDSGSGASGDDAPSAGQALPRARGDREARGEPEGLGGREGREDPQGRVDPGGRGGREVLRGLSGELRELSGEEVCFYFAANPGEPLLPLAKVASGGELARAMLALRLVLLGAGASSRGPTARGSIAGPETLVFDEVDAGIGGEAALAVGRALAELGRRYQVVVVTHLAQVAAFAGAQVAVSKSERAGRAVTDAVQVAGEDRVIELSRMLSGHPNSKAAREHAEELLRGAGGAKGVGNARSAGGVKGAGAPKGTGSGEGAGERSRAGRH